MVRVISVHHFSRQDIQSVDSLTASCSAPPDRLLVAGSSHSIEVRNLNAQGTSVFSFPSVDEVQQMIHCQHGDYIATIETKRNYSNKIFYYARVYVNWDSVATLQQAKMTNSGMSLGLSECGMVQPMRARIAGRVTPSSNQTDGSNLEMIELPIRRSPEKITCCQMSGNIAVLSNRTLSFFKFMVRSHDLSRIKFIDFEELSFYIDLSFKPTHISLAENYIACMNDQCFHFFKINSSCDSSKNDTIIPATDDVIEDDCINFKLLVENDLRNSGDVHVFFPRISGRTVLNMCPTDVSDITASVKTISSVGEPQKYVIENLLQLKLLPLILDGSLREVVEDFKCMVLKPVYTKHTTWQPRDIHSKCMCSDNPFKSEFYIDFAGISCMVATQQEGYLYYFNTNDRLSAQTESKCLAVYPFTAPVSQIILEDGVLHALTDTGLESYTLRVGHQLARYLDNIDNINSACPARDEPICLIGLRPFLGVKWLHCSGKYLVLLASAESTPSQALMEPIGSWTLYSLELPTSDTLYNDFYTLALMHKEGSPSTFCHLMGEAHVIIRIANYLKKYSNHFENYVSLLEESETVNKSIETSYKDSCLILADYYIMCDNREQYQLAIPYYKMANMTIQQVFNRVRNFQLSGVCASMQGFLNYIKHTISILTISSETDHLFSSSSETLIGESGPQGFSEALLGLLSNHSPDLIPYLTLHSPVLREYATDKLIHVLEVNEKNCNNTTLVALSLLYTQKSLLAKATSLLERVKPSDLFAILDKKYDLLIERSSTKSDEKTFTEFTSLLISTSPEMLGKILSDFVYMYPVENLSSLIKLFMDYIPSRIGKEGQNAQQVLKNVLEQYFKINLEVEPYINCFADNNNIDALKILIRMYLGQLQYQFNLCSMKKSNTSIYKKIMNPLPNSENTAVEVDQKNENHSNKQKQTISDSFKTEFKCLENNIDILFVKLRHPYLHKIPPFGQNLFAEDDNNLTELEIANFIHKDFIIPLIKLQGFLSLPNLPDDICDEVIQFVNMNPNFLGADSLKMCVLNLKEGTLLLLDKYPQCLLQYGRDRFKNGFEYMWTYLIMQIECKITDLKGYEDSKISKRRIEYYETAHHDLLTCLAKGLSLNTFIKVLPNKRASPTRSSVVAETNPLYDTSSDSDTNDSSEYSEIFNIALYEPYIKICKQHAHANNVREMIKTTGQQLLQTLTF